MNITALAPIRFVPMMVSVKLDPAVALAGFIDVMAGEFCPSWRSP
jgi:hypothetical protein